ncbi:hypothetical protein ACHHV8_32960 [Paenibacillus sp. TAB 01]|uniref:hypothetical protein n=1 Tax=Paenibacillus sp. TAB 01 TaxID=3368988 RepID=UPI003751AE25
MKHYTLERWTQYARQEPPLTPQEEAELEQHLQQCDTCLELYMLGLEEAEADYPALADPQVLLDQVMLKLPPMAPTPQADFSPLPAKKIEDRRTGWLRHPVFHYTVAAAITVVLMSSGAFQTIVDRLQPGDSYGSEAMKLEHRDKGQAERTSMSQTIMNKTIVMLDAIQAKHERGGTR